MLKSSVAAVAVLCAGPAGVAVAAWAPDFLVSVMRFGVECEGPGKLRNKYVGDGVRFAVSIERRLSPVSHARAPRLTKRVAYRAFYRDLAPPEADGLTVVLRCKGEAKCLAAYQNGAVERIAAYRLGVCSAAVAGVVADAARELLQGQE